jgi:glycosyl transferase, family 25
MPVESISRSVINLKTRPDRKREMEHQLSLIKWNDAQFSEAIQPSDQGAFPSVGARGCFLSHLSVLKNAIGKGHLIILEDDVNFVSDFGVLWATALTELEKKRWSICYLGHLYERLPEGLNFLQPSKPVQCSHFMFFHGGIIRTIVDKLEVMLNRPAGHPDGGPMHVDGAYTTIRAQNPDIITYACSPILGYQRPSRTDVGRQKWFDRIENLRPAVSMLRRFKRTIPKDNH